jgi:Putative ATPase subunit of terminase (gpP-like)
MARRVEVTDLVGAAEIAERLGLSHRETVHSYRRRYSDFPEPVARLRQALVWSWRDVERWARKTGRLPRKKQR